MVSLFLWGKMSNSGSLRIFTVLGARPQFIKAAPVNKALRETSHSEFILHTGQHYDYGMSQVFFDELNIPQPDINLGVGSGPHGQQTGQMLERIEEALLAESPDWVLVYGDTNSTLAGALSAAKLHIPVAHVEAGLRSFNRQMPEEHNRVLADHCADLLFCPTQTAVDNLAKEGITQGVHLVGDVMYDAVLQFAEIASRRSTIMQKLGLESRGYLLATIHRPYNTDVPVNMRNILSVFAEIEEPVVFPVHPRTRQRIAEYGLGDLQSKIRNPIFIDPVGYLDMLTLEKNARMILTDSGGVQKEAYFFAVPCITLRPETEWVETVEVGWNLLRDAEFSQILQAVNEHHWPVEPPPPIFGDGNAAKKVIAAICGKG